jgi:hypothetical protein
MSFAFPGFGMQPSGFVGDVACARWREAHSDCQSGRLDTATQCIAYRPSSVVISQDRHARCHECPEVDARLNNNVAHAIDVLGAREKDRLVVRQAGIGELSDQPAALRWSVLISWMT